MIGRVGSLQCRSTGHLRMCLLRRSRAALAGIIGGRELGQYVLAWLRAARSLITSSAAISVFDLPWAISRTGFSRNSGLPVSPF